MITLRVELGERSYDIRFGSGLLDVVGWTARQVCPSRSVAVVTNPVIGGLYAARVLHSLDTASIRSALVTIPAGEKYKNLNVCRRLYNDFLDARLDRGSAVIALGGGVIGDIAGFAAATYLRGIPFVQVPTTLLAQVDSSIGGKVGVNLPRGKNLIGSFHQPAATLIDPTVLRTLPKRELRAGLSEVIKHGIIHDQEFFEYLQANIRGAIALDEDVISEAIARSCVIKAGVVSADERESGLREILNFGHTIGHGVENAAGYGRYRHGEAVAIGMVGEAMVGERAGITPAGTADVIAGVLRAAGLPVTLAPGVSAEAVLSSMALDKKARQGKIRFVLPVSIGSVTRRDDIDPGLVRDVVRELKRDT